MKLFKVIASKAGRVVFDDRVQAESPREAREQMKTLTGLQSLSGVVYAVTEIPVELILSIVDARVTEAVQRIQRGKAAESIESLIRPIASEEVRQQLATLRDQIAALSTRTPQQVNGTARYDAFTAAAEVPVEDHILNAAPVRPKRRNGAAKLVKPAKTRKARPAETTDGRRIDWRAVKKLYKQNRSHKQTAAHFELSVNSVKARCRREGWGA